MDNDGLKAAYEILAEALQRAHEAGRQKVTGTGLRQQLRLLDASFDPLALGFQNFKGFLLAAERHGLLVLEERPGSDFLVRSSSVPEPGEGRSGDDEVVGEANAGRLARDVARQGTRIRGDLWRAFVDAKPGYRRVYDRHTDRVYVAPESRQVLIEPIPVDVQQRWMLEFAEGLEDTAAREDLARIASSPSGYREFFQRVQELHIAANYHAFRLERVQGVIQRWIADHDLTIDVNSEPPLTPARETALGRSTRGDELPPTPRRPEAPPRDAPNDFETMVRARLKEAIDSMGLADLLRLPIPVEYILKPTR